MDRSSKSQLLQDPNMAAKNVGIIINKMRLSNDVHEACDLHIIGLEKF